MIVSESQKYCLIMLIGYARVSTKEQSLDIQIDELKQYGCIRVLSDYAVSGAKRDRVGLQKALDMLEKDDTLVVHRLDRLGRSVKQIIDTVELIKNKECNLVSLTQNIDTSTMGGKIMLYTFAMIAEIERDLTLERSKIGMDKAKANGVIFGRKRKVNSNKQSLLIQLKQEGKSTQEICQMLDISKATLYRRLKND